MHLNLFSRPGPSLISPYGNSFSVGQVFKDFNSNTFFDAFCPDPTTGSARIPIVEDRRTLRTALLTPETAQSFRNTLEEMFAEAKRDPDVGALSGTRRMMIGGRDREFVRLESSEIRRTQTVRIDKAASSNRIRDTYLLTFGRITTDSEGSGRCHQTLILTAE